ncbi:ubiquitin-conjugating enzyme [Trichoderma arundinaceum]|uniref:Ubiquitin-conjugating enzyme E2 2 n=1 Tax=Trichoderma arundinaceum TaxID=490622 RepID=A0A395P0H1_TRIAR|nr:ubiquitin-conjugating enzyme [Trichoderma arundinaceum]
MSNSRDRRIMKELQDLTEDKDSSGIHAAPDRETSLTSLKGWFYGPGNTPYEGGKYVIRIALDSEYPFKPPRMQFETKIWHPNVSSQTGAICLDTLKNNWSPVQTIKTALLSVRMLLENPNPSDPQDAQVASMLLQDPQGFVLMAHEWAVKHAGAPRQPKLNTARFDSLAKSAPSSVRLEEQRFYGYNGALINRFVTMGFQQDRVAEALIYFGIDRNNGQDYALTDAQVGDVTARLLGEQ